MSRNLSWHQGRALAFQGKAIRRDAWRKWLTHGHVIWFIHRTNDLGAALRYVLYRKASLRRRNFSRTIGTDEPWIDPVTGIPVTPPTGTPGAPDGGTGGTGTFGGPSNPPGPGGSGGGGGFPPGDPGDDPDDPQPPPSPPPGQTPTVYVTFNSMDPDQTDLACLSEPPTSPVKMTFTVTIVGGPPGVFPLSVNLQGQTWVGTGWPGMTQDISFSNVNVTYGSVLDVDTANYSVNGTVYTGSGDSPKEPNECDGSCDHTRGCCPGEDGHRCSNFTDGAMEFCCCCPAYKAPALPDCRCVYVG